MTKQLWKFMGNNLTSRSGDNCKWTLGKWKTHTGELKLCSAGFHASDRIYDAMKYVAGFSLCRVEVRGDSYKQDDKSVWRGMRVVKVYAFSKRDYVAFAIFCAEECLGNFEKACPQDNRPRLAIEACKAVFENDNDITRSAARSAARSARSAARSAWSAAWSADSAAESARSADSARSAARSARSAAWSARSAAESAESAAGSADSADSAWSAAWCADSAAKSAARSASQNKMEEWLQNHIKTKGVK